MQQTLWRFSGGYRNNEQDESLSQTVARKKGDESSVADVGPLSDDFPGKWAVLADKGYQGATKMLRVVHSVKRIKNRAITRDDERFNPKVSGDRIIVENVFSRLCSLWTVVGSKVCWAEASYDTIFCFRLSMTNLHVKWNTLRAGDQDFYVGWKNRL